MKQIRVLIITLITLGLLNACKKKTLPEPEEGNNPQFYFSGIVNGSAVRIDAGVNDYYMYSSYSQNTVGVYGFAAELKQGSCTNCPNSIKIEINDHRYSMMNGPSGADTALSYMYYPYFAGNPTPVSYNVYFYSLFNKNALSYLWDFGDGTTSTTKNPSHIFMHPGEYVVSLTSTDSSSCSNTVTNVQKVGSSDTYCKTTVTVTGTSSLNATFTNSTIGVPPYNFYWDLGDGNFSTSSSPTHNYATGGRYPVSLQVIDAANDTATANFNYITANSTVCTTNYLVMANIPMSNPMAISNIVVKWTDVSGTEWSSNSNLQPASSYFKIISASDYHTNELGQKTKKLLVRFKCQVYNGSNSMPMDGDAIVVVAYK